MITFSKYRYKPMRLAGQMINVALLMTKLDSFFLPPHQFSCSRNNVVNKLHTFTVTIFV